MASFNKITIIGYLGRDPELKYTPQGKTVCTFSVATSERRKDKAGEYQDHTTWFRVTCFDRLAENVTQHLTKGSRVYVEGRLRAEDWTDREGRARTSLEVTATEIRFLDKAEGTETGVTPQAAAVAAQAPATGRNASSAQPTPQPEPQPLYDDDIPF